MASLLCDISQFNINFNTSKSDSFFSEQAEYSLRLPALGRLLLVDCHQAFYPETSESSGICIEVANCLKILLTSAFHQSGGYIFQCAGSPPECAIGLCVSKFYNARPEHPFQSVKLPCLCQAYRPTITCRTENLIRHHHYFMSEFLFHNHLSI